MSSCSDNDIVKAYREGASLSQVADRYGVSRSHVYRTILRLAPSTMRKQGPPRRTSPSERDLEIVEAYREGATLDQVADRCGVSWRTVYRTIRAIAPWILRRQGAPRRPDPNERDRRILENRRAGMTLAEIGELEGLSRQRVHVILKRWRYAE